MVAKSALGRLMLGRGAPATSAPAPVTREALESAGVPVLRATLPARGADVLLTPKDVKGNIVTWSGAGGLSLTLRDGVLIQSRGLGPDLMSAEAPSVRQLATNGGTHQRIYYFLGADDQTTRRSYDCSVAVKGTERIEIFQKTHSVTRLSETCTRGQETITNEFWIEGQTVRKSRQLLSAAVGFAEFEKVVD